MAWRSTARSTANGQISDRWGNGRPARSTEAWIQRAVSLSGRPGLSREQSSLPVDRPSRPGLSREQKLSGGRPGRSTSPPAKLACMFCARRSTNSIDRLLARSTGPVDRQNPEQGFMGLENLAFYFQINPTKFLKIHKNSFSIILWYTNMFE